MPTPKEITNRWLHGLTPQELIKLCQEVEKRYPDAKLQGNNLENIVILEEHTDDEGIYRDFLGYIDTKPPGKINWHYFAEEEEENS